MKYLSFDPGNSTGIMFYDSETDTYEAECIYEDTIAIEDYIKEKQPDVIIYEVFQLYPGKARQQAWSTFYPCEVIGVIKHIAKRLECKVISQPASIKPYSKVDSRYPGPKGNQHMKDAYMHLWYYRNMKE